MTSREVVFACYLAVAVACSATDSGRNASQVLRPITDGRDVFAVYTEDWGFTPGRDPALVVALWPDGYVVWSADRIRGGKPYHAARISPDTLSKFVARIQCEGRFRDETLVRSWAPWESELTTVRLSHSEHAITLRSAHELDPNHATAPGKLRRQYEEFRSLWDEIRSWGDGFIPSTGSLVDGELVMKSGAAAWKEY